MSGLTDALDALGSQDTDLWVGSDQEEDDNNGGGAIEEDGEEELALTDDASAETTAGVPQANTLPPAIRFKGALRSGSQESTRRDRPALFYPIWIKPTTLEVTSVGEPLPLDVAPDFGPDLDGNVPAWPIREDGSLGRWQVHAPTMRAKVATGEVRVGRYDPRRKTYPISYLPDSAKTAGGPETRAGTRRLKTVWRMSRHDAGAHGSDLLKNFLGQGGLFAFPKSLYAVRDVLASVIREKPDALVLDFFAGSGTTLHATCLLNAEDNGRRRCVLVTSNEVDEKQATILQKQGLRRGDIEYEAQGIFERVTRPRCEAALTGRRPDGTPVPGRYANGRPHAEGFMENIEFFRLDYLDKDEVELGRDFEAINPCLWLMSGGRGSRLINGVSQGWSIPEGGTYAVLFNEARFRVFKKALVSARLVERVFLVTDSNEAYAEMVDALGEEWATSMLYRDYLRNFQINTLETQ